MPSPIAHSVSGYVLAKFLPQEKLKYYPSRWWSWEIFYPVFVAIFADFDFLPQLITGERFHRGITHTFVFAIAFSLIVSWLISYCRKSCFKQLFFLTLVIYSSHLVLDFFTATSGSGLQLFWPFTDTYLKSAIPFFPSVHHSRGLFDPSHLIFIIWESCYSILVLSVLWFWKNYSSRKLSE
ncbi:MAG: metal-dependent hydrolase [Okeania sp. SIO2C2]|uniref:metal-dependent hydrolase n=1 Tax=Okeania sp. SIO2C2 TaxID=2607787 RepID=UPI0013B5BCEA|nr:metal-dependent hydrolase [Okeania sp. SIO2C2]NEP88151.1 metal-dependent hydrolase [Okeania sp. SIO2C2]